MPRIYIHAGFMLAVLGSLAMIASAFQPGSAGRDVTIAEAGVAEGGEAGGAVAVARDGSGQFHVDAAVNGEEVNFLVDTGADVVALGPDEAERLGIEFDPESFQPIMQTASGTGRGVVTTIDRLEIAGRELRDVPVAVVEGLRMNLLGQSALRKLGRVSANGDRMVIGS